MFYVQGNNFEQTSSYRMGKAYMNNMVCVY